MPAAIGGKYFMAHLSNVLWLTQLKKVYSVLNNNKTLDC